MAPTAAQAAAMASDAQAFQTYAGTVNAAVVRRWLWWQTMRGERSAVAVLVRAAPAGLDALVNANAAADSTAQKWAQVMVGLERGELELCDHSQDEGNTLTLGVVQAGSVPGGGLNGWPLVAAIVVAAVGVWLLVDAWLTARQTEAEATRLHQANVLAATQAIAAARTPADAKLIADAIAKANAAIKAPPVGILDRIAQGISDAIKSVTDAATSGASGFVVLGLVLWALSRRGKR